MRPMRRQDRAVTDPEKIQNVIDRCSYCCLGLCDQGKPYVVPVNFGHTMENGRHCFYFHGAPEGRKIELVRETGWACIEMHEGYRLKKAELACSHTAAFRSVIASGPVSIVEDPEEKRQGLEQIMGHITGTKGWSYSEESLGKVCVYKLTVEELSCKEHL